MGHGMVSSAIDELGVADGNKCRIEHPGLSAVDAILKKPAKIVPVGNPKYQTLVWRKRRWTQFNSPDPSPSNGAGDSNSVGASQ